MWSYMYACKLTSSRSLIQMSGRKPLLIHVCWFLSPDSSCERAWFAKEAYFHVFAPTESQVCTFEKKSLMKHRSSAGVFKRVSLFLEHLKTYRRVLENERSACMFILRQMRLDLVFCKNYTAAGDLKHHQHKWRHCADIFWYIYSFNYRPPPVNSSSSSAHIN